MPPGATQIVFRRNDLTVLAYRLLQAGTPPEFQDVPEPSAGSG